MPNSLNRNLFIAVSIAAAMSTALATAANAAECPKGQRADDFAGWRPVLGNAISAAEAYAIKRNPNATFVRATAEIHFQRGGPQAGSYFVQLIAPTPLGTAFARLKPNFDFCADPTALDDERTDLFSMLSAKLDGRPF